MTDLGILSVIILGVGKLKSLHELRKGSILSFYKKMDMIGH
jgi:hypothetical protein